MLESTENESVTGKFNRICAQQLELCQQLESIADSLGDRPDLQSCAQMARRLEKIMAQAHNFEENELFPALKRLLDPKNPQNTNMPPKIGLGILKQLESEYHDDMGLAGEVVEALSQFSADQTKISPNAIGYLLRNFFVGLRRHLALENEILRFYEPGSELLA